MNLIKNKYLILIVLFIISLIGIVSFFHSGFFPSHDGEWMVVRFSDFHRSLADGQWPARWAGRLNFGFGYPVFNFLYPGTFYITEIFHLLKLNFVNSVKATFIVSYLLSGIFMFLFARQWWGKWGGLVAAVLYLYTPYRFVDMYVRGSLGESVAFIFPPLIFLAITKIYQHTNMSVILGRSKATTPESNKNGFWASQNDENCFWIAGGSLGIAGLITTHNVIAYLFLPIIILFILFLHFTSSSKKNVKLFTVNCLLFTVLGLAAAAFFWLPALWDKQYTIFDQVVISDFSKNFASIKELIFPSWGYGPSRPGDPGSMSFQIGIINIVIVLISVILIIVRAVQSRHSGERSDSRIGFWTSQNDGINIELFFLIITILAIFFMTSFSQSLWQYIPGLSLIQFPWRILSVTTFTTAFLAGYAVTSFKNKQFIPAAIVIVLSLLFNFSYIKPSQFVDRSEGYYATNDDTTTVQKEYLPIGANNLTQKRAANKVEIISGQGTINNLITKSNKTDFNYQGTAGLLKINTVYFPGWEALVNGQKSDIIVDKQGLINLALEDGKSMVETKFMETPIRKTSDLISLVSLFSILALFLYSM